ncbi:hypothetical protein AgCh_004814 [Apium graveolens]
MNTHELEPLAKKLHEDRVTRVDNQNGYGLDSRPRPDSFAGKPTGVIAGGAVLEDPIKPDPTLEMRTEMSSKNYGKMGNEAEVKKEYETRQNTSGKEAGQASGSSYTQGVDPYPGRKL